MVVSCGSPSWRDELGIGVEIAGAQLAGLDVRDGVFTAIGFHLNSVVGAMKDIVLERGLDAGAEIGDSVAIGDDAVAHGDGNVRQTVVTNVQGVGPSGGIVVDGDIDDLEEVAVILFFDHETGPGTTAADSITGAVDQAVLDLAAAPPEFDTIAPVVGDDTVVDIGVARL